MSSLKFGESEQDRRPSRVRLARDRPHRLVPFDDEFSDTEGSENCANTSEDWDPYAKMVSLTDGERFLLEYARVDMHT